MATKRKSASKATATADYDLGAVLRQLEQNASKQFREDMAKRYGIVTQAKVFGTPVAKIRALAKPLGTDQHLAETLWRTGVYEARMLASMVGDAERLTGAQMDRWIKDCDNWALVDTLAFNLFDRTPHAFAKVSKWAMSKDEFVNAAGSRCSRAWRCTDAARTTTF